MKHDRRYKSSIPGNALEQVFENTDDGRLVDCFLNRKLVGRRQYDENGYLCQEIPLKDGQRHGVVYRWSFDGTLESAEPYNEGLAHGVAKQWSPSGKLMGSYKMKHGTGIDLWWHSIDGTGEAPFYLSEVHYMRHGTSHGYTWWLNEDQTSVHIERHFLDGVQHGIFREWNEQGRICRGFPQYFVNGTKLSKRQYIRASILDESLPRFCENGNDPSRVFPTEISRYLLRHEDA